MAGKQLLHSGRTLQCPPLNEIAHHDAFLLRVDTPSLAFTHFVPTTLVVTALAVLASVFGLLFTYAVYCLVGTAFSFGYFGSAINYVGYEMCLLVALLTCRTTVMGVKEASRRNQGDRRTAPTRVLRRAAPCIDWTLLEPGTWGLAFVTVLVWTVPVLMVRVAVVSVDPADETSKLIDLPMYFVLGMVQVFALVEVAPGKRFWERVVASVIASAWNLLSFELGRLLIGATVALALLDPSGGVGTIITQLLVETASLFVCFCLPDAPRPRHTVLRSLTPSAYKIPALFHPSFSRHYPLVEPCPNASESPDRFGHPRNPASVAVEQDHAAKALASCGFSVRFACCTAARVSLFLIGDASQFAVAAGVGFAFQWAATASLVRCVRASSDRCPLLQCAAPIPSFEALAGLQKRLHQPPPLHIAAQAATVSTVASETNPIFDERTRERLIAVSHYTATISSLTSTILAAAIVWGWILPAMDPRVTATPPASLLGRGWTLEASFAAFYEGSVFLRAAVVVAADVVAAIGVVLCVGRPRGLSYGRCGAWWGWQVDELWDPREHLFGPADAAMQPFLTAFVVGAVLAGIGQVF